MTILSNVENISPKGQKKYQLLVDSAVSVIKRDGINACNHRMVAKEAAVSLGTTTYYFKTLDDLLYAALEKHIQNFRVSSSMWVKNNPANDNVSNLTCYFLWTLQDKSQLGSEYSLYVAAISRPVLKPLAIEWLDTVCDLLIQEFRLSPLKAKIIASFMDGIFIRGLLEGDSEVTTPETLHNTLSALIKS